LVQKTLLQKNILSLKYTIFANVRKKTRSLLPFKGNELQE